MNDNGTTITSSGKHRTLSTCSRILSSITPKPRTPTASKRSNSLPETPSSSWNRTSQAFKDLERQMKTKEWKTAALRSDVFSSPGLRRLMNAGKRSAKKS